VPPSIRRPSRGTQTGPAVASRRAPRRRSSRLRWVCVLVSVGVLAALFASNDAVAGSRSSHKRAAILDQLSLTAPNPAFIDAATQELELAGYSVVYYRGDEVTVDLYRSLPTLNYDLVILRAHAGLLTVTNRTTQEVTHEDAVSIFTGEPYEANRYPREEGTAQLGPSRLVRGGIEQLKVFGISPAFVRYSMQGTFHDTLIVMMGCDGLRSPETALPFLEKGASAFIGWTDSVSVEHTDATTKRLLDKLLTDKLPVRDAVAQTAAEMGPDPTYGAELRVAGHG
jgi:hypothetical protein